MRSLCHLLCFVPICVRTLLVPTDFSSHRFNDGPRLSEASPAANAPAEAEASLSCKHRGQDTTSVTGATPADRYPLYVSGQKAKPLSGCGGWIHHCDGALPDGLQAGQAARTHNAPTRWLCFRRNRGSVFQSTAAPDAWALSPCSPVFWYFVFGTCRAFPTGFAILPRRSALFCAPPPVRRQCDHHSSLACERGSCSVLPARLHRSSYASLQRCPHRGLTSGRIFHLLQ